MSNHQIHSQAARTSSYDQITQGLHWGMAAIIISVLAAIEIKDMVPKGEFRQFLLSWHYQIGIAVFFLVVFRIAWRRRHPAPSIIPKPPKSQVLGAQFAHYALYLLMLVQPVLGVLVKQSRGDSVDFLGLHVPAFLDEDSGLPYALTLNALHTYLGDMFIALIAAHVVFALIHHFVRKDNALNRMLPKQHKAP